MIRRDPYRHYRRQMRRGWRTRHGRYGYPVILSSPYEPLAALAFAAAGRLAYRHRSAFLPFTIAISAWILAAIVHQHHAHWWIATVLITVAAGVFLGMPHRLSWAHPAGKLIAGFWMRAWEACGIARPAERVYAATVTVACGGWLSAAIAAGPSARPLPGISVAVTVVLGIPWWAHRRRRARVRIERVVQAWPDLAENMGLPGSRIASATGDTWGFTARVILRKGTTAAQAINQIPAIESGLGIRPGSVRALPDPNRADRLILRVIETDPHAQPIPWEEQPNPSITKPVNLGLTEDGNAVSIRLLRRNVLIGGIMGSGKSGIVNIILAYLAACRDVTVWGIDLKGGMELQPWAACLAGLATTPQQATQMLADAVTELERRAAFLAAHGARVWEPTSSDPALIIVIDEYAELPAEALEYADSIGRRGRAVAVNLHAATQKPTQEAMGNNAVRSQMDVRVCLRVAEKRDTDLILGQGAVTAGWHAHMLTEPGTFLLKAPEYTAPERHRAYLITDDQVAACAARHARPPAGPGADAPAGPSETPRTPQTPRSGPDPAQVHPTAGEATQAAESALWDALCQAPAEGLPVWVLMSACRKSRSWVYGQLSALAAQGHAVQPRYGSWRAADPGNSDGL